MIMKLVLWSGMHTGTLMGEKLYSLYNTFCGAEVFLIQGPVKKYQAQATKVTCAALCQVEGNLGENNV